LPVKVFIADRVSIPEPALVNDPLPEIIEAEELLELVSIVKLLILETFESRVNAPSPDDNLNALLAVLEPLTSE
jgi:hypothetical protein